MKLDAIALVRMYCRFLLRLKTIDVFVAHRERLSAFNFSEFFFFGRISENYQHFNSIALLHFISESTRARLLFAQNEKQTIKQNDFEIA